MFAYCLNNPVNMIDPNGMCSTAADMLACMNGGNCCSHDHCSAEYLILRSDIEKNTAWNDIPEYLREHNRTMLTGLDSNFRHKALNFLAKSYNAGHTLFVTWGLRDVDPDFPYGPHIYRWAFDF